MRRTRMSGSKIALMLSYRFAGGMSDSLRRGNTAAAMLFLVFESQERGQVGSFRIIQFSHNMREWSNEVRREWPFHGVTRLVSPLSPVRQVVANGLPAMGQ